MPPVQDSGGRRQLSYRSLWGIGIRLADLRLELKALAFVLTTWMQPDGSRCRPGMAAIGKALGRSERTVQRWMRELEGTWLLTTRGGRSRNTYRPIIPLAVMSNIEAVLSGNGDTQSVGVSEGMTTPGPLNGDTALSRNGDTQVSPELLGAFKSGGFEEELEEPDPEREADDAETRRLQAEGEALRRERETRGFTRVGR
jgi:hypothetical protein